MDSKHSILLVDDEPSIRALLSAILKTEGYTVETAEDGYAALRSMRRTAPDLLITDLRMPNMNGFELLAAVRSGFPTVPSIAISGEFVGDRVEGILADAFFQKGSYVPSDLIRKVKELLAQGKAPQPAKPHGVLWSPTKDAPVMLTCNACLKSFPIDPCDEVLKMENRTRCIFCGAELVYRLLAVSECA